MSTTNDIDLNQIFTLNYNFDLLKTILSGLIKQNKSMENQLVEIKERINDKDKQIIMLDSKLTSSIKGVVDRIDERINDKIKDFEDSLLKEKEKEQAGNTKENHMIKEEKEEKARLSLDLLKPNENSHDLLKKINELYEKDKEKQEKIDQIQREVLDIKSMNLFNLKEKTDVLQEKVQYQEENNLENTKIINKFQKEIENLKVKLDEVNIFESFKMTSSNSNDPSGDISKYFVLIEGLKKSVFQKFEYTDGKIETIQEGLNRVKLDLGIYSKKNENLLSDSIEMKDKIYELDRNSNENKGNISKILVQISNLSNEISNSTLGRQGKSIKNEDFEEENRKEEEIQELKNRITSLEDELTSFKNTMLPNSNKKSYKNMASSDSLGHSLSDKRQSNFNLVNVNKDEKNVSNSNLINPSLASQLKNKITELEKNIRILTLKDKEKEEMFNKKLKTIIENISSKVSMDDFYKLNDMISNINSQLEVIKERLSGIDEKTILGEIAWIKKKIEILSSGQQEIRNVLSKSSGLNINTSDLQNDGMNNGKYVDLTVFNDFVKLEYGKEIGLVKDGIKDIYKRLEDFMLSLKTKADSKEMKLLEDGLLTKIDDLRLGCLRKYADKQETSKNLKYLDISIKQINENILKKMEKGDNWLLAKKPIGGNSCASCEAFIGELHENKEYIPWNKLRDSAEKMYRIGNGFSKMLQMVNIDERKENDSMQKADYLNLNENDIIKRNFIHITTSLPELKRVKLNENEKNKNGSLYGKLNKTYYANKEGKDVKEKEGKEGKGLPLKTHVNNLSIELPDMKEIHNEEEMIIQNEGPKIMKIYKIRKEKGE